MKITWSGNLQISSGDKIQILRGKGNPENGQIQATVLRNITRGIAFESDSEHILATEMPHNFEPSITGYARNVVIHERSASFDLEENAPPIVSAILRECERFLDAQLYERCKDKDYHDVVTNAFPVLEDRIRAKIGVDPSCCGTTLIDTALNPKTGKLAVGNTSSEREAVHLMFRGAIGFLRNPPSHHIANDENNIEAFEIICMVDLLLRIADKAKMRS